MDEAEIMDKQFFEENLKEIRYCEKRRKRVLGVNILGGISLAFSFVSLFLILAILLRETDDRLMQFGLVFATLLFSLIGMIMGTIGFLKARILKKGGYYATTGTVLNLFGLVISTLEVAGLLAFAILKIFL